MEDVGVIQNKVNSFFNDTLVSALRTRWEKDFDLYRLEPYRAGKGYISYTTNSPRVFAQKVISILAQAKLLIRIPDEILQQPEMVIASDMERFLYGCFRINDERLRRNPRMPLLREQMAWHACIRGGFLYRPYVYKNKKGKTIPEV